MMRNATYPTLQKPDSDDHRHVGRRGTRKWKWPIKSTCLLSPMPSPRFDLALKSCSDLRTPLQCYHCTAGPQRHARMHCSCAE